jgi:hypothetical protein
MGLADRLEAPLADIVDLAGVETVDLLVPDARALGQLDPPAVREALDDVLPDPVALKGARRVQLPARAVAAGSR